MSLESMLKERDNIEYCKKQYGWNCYLNGERFEDKHSELDYDIEQELRR